MRTADRLELCERGNRCCSGACPECGWLLQRRFVRKSKRLICETVDKDGHSLVAISIVPAKAIIRPGKLHTLYIRHLRRCLKYALAQASIDIAISAIDFSFNEDKDGRYEPFWSAHYYVITPVANEVKVSKCSNGSLRAIGEFQDQLKSLPLIIRRDAGRTHLRFNTIDESALMSIKYNDGRRLNAQMSKYVQTETTSCRAVGIVHLPRPHWIWRAIYFSRCEASHQIEQGQVQSNRRLSRRIRPK